MKSRGFTLIEMLVAVGLVALMGVVCWRGLAFIANQRASVEQETTELADIALPARATTPELPLAVAIGSGANGSAELEILRTVAIGVEQSQPVRVLYHVDGRGLVRSTGADDVLVLPKVARFEVRVNAGGFWLDAGQAQAMQPAVRPFTRAGAIEIMVDDREGARYVKVLAL